MLAGSHPPRTLNSYVSTDPDNSRLYAAFRAVINMDFELCNRLLISQIQTQAQSNEDRRKCWAIYIRLLNQVSHETFASLNMSLLADRTWSELDQVYDEMIPSSVVRETARACVKHSIQLPETIKRAWEFNRDIYSPQAILLELWPRINMSVNHADALLESLQITESDKTALRESRRTSGSDHRREESSTVKTDIVQRSESIGPTQEIHDSRAGHANTNDGGLLMILAGYWRNKLVGLRHSFAETALNNAPRVIFIALILYAVSWQRIRIIKVLSRVASHLRYVLMTAARSL